MGGKTPMDLDAAYAAGDGTTLFLDDKDISARDYSRTAPSDARTENGSSTDSCWAIDASSSRRSSEAKSRDALPCVVVLKDDDVLAIDLFLHHLYMKIDDPCAELYNHCPDTKTTINLVILAEIYGVTQLAEFAAGLVEEDMKQIVTPADCRVFFPWLLSAFDREGAIGRDFYGIKQGIIKIIVKPYKEHADLREWINGLLGQSSELRKRFVEFLM